MQPPVCFPSSIFHLQSFSASSLQSRSRLTYSTLMRIRMLTSRQAVFFSRCVIFHHNRVKQTVVWPLQRRYSRTLADELGRNKRGLLFGQKSNLIFEDWPREDGFSRKCDCLAFSLDTTKVKRILPHMSTCLDTNKPRNTNKLRESQYDKQATWKHKFRTVQPKPDILFLIKMSPTSTAGDGALAAIGGERGGWGGP